MANRCIVRVASPLRSYTANAELVEGRGASLREVLANLDADYPGMRFRMIDEQDAIRPHIRLFVNKNEVLQIDYPVADGDTVHLIAALSGG
jgi:molybdopterin synthase sulfur carrier subunit